MAKKTKIEISVLILFVALFGVLSWFMMINENKVEKEAVKYTHLYMKKQGIERKDVTLFEVMDAPKQDGYVVWVETNKDPGVRYEYLYTEFTKKRKEHVLVTAFGKDNEEIVTPKYKVSE